MVLAHLVEIIDNDTDKKVHDKVRPDQHEEHEEPDAHHVRIPYRLHIFLRRVNSGVHHRRPRLGGGDLEERQQGLSDVVELLRDGHVPVEPEAGANLCVSTPFRVID